MNARMVLVAVVAAYVVPIRAEGQTCTGFASFTDGPMQLAGSALFNDNAKEFAAGFAVGGSGPFGNVSVGTTSFDEVDASSFNLGAGVGYQVKLDSKGIAYLCPMAAVNHASGPNDLDVFGDGSFVADFSETDLLFGISLGVVASQSGKTKIIPTGSLSFVSGTVKVEEQGTGVSDSQTESFGLLGLGIGFILNSVVTLRPGVSIPFGLEGASTSFGAAISVNFGAKR